MTTTTTVDVRQAVSEREAKSFDTAELRANFLMDKLFEAGLGLSRVELNRASLHRHLLAFPWMSAKTVLGIYWQALRLLLKRTPIFSHSAADGEFRSAHLEPRHEES